MLIVPKFSILHTTARPDSWRASYDAWMRSCAHPEDVEYILCVDSRWGFTMREGEHKTTDGSTFTVVYNHGRKCMVDGYTAAAAKCTGEVIILNSDDMRPCKSRYEDGDDTPVEWDLQLLEEIAPLGGLTSDFVVQVSSGTAADTRNLMVLQILSRARFLRLGYTLYPGYESMYADDDYSEHARADGVVINARHLLFPHEHPATPDTYDPVYKHQNRSAAYELGSRLLALRRSIGFGAGAPAAPSENTTGRQTIVGLCIPGDNFSGPWLGQFIGLFSNLICHGYGVMTFMAQSSNVYVTRGVILDGILRAELKPDLLVWLDHDNILTYEHFEMLKANLDSHPEADIIGGWCWCQPDGYDVPAKTSCGRVTEGEDPVSVDGDYLKAASALVEVEYTGFPGLLMRGNLPSRVGAKAFAPILAPNLHWGTYGEDVSFCIRARQLGAHIYIDSRVELPHLKLRAVQPFMAGAGTAIPVEAA